MDDQEYCYWCSEYHMEPVSSGGAPCPNCPDFLDYLDVDSTGTYANPMFIQGGIDLDFNELVGEAGLDGAYDAYDYFFPEVH